MHVKSRETVKSFLQANKGESFRIFLQANKGEGQSASTSATYRHVMCSGEASFEVSFRVPKDMLLLLL